MTDRAAQPSSRLWFDPSYLLVSIVAVLAAWHSREALSDDAYILLRVVRHGLEGQGLRFNPDDVTTQVCTSPLNLLLTLAVAWVGTLAGLSIENACLMAPGAIAMFAFPLLGCGMLTLARGGTARYGVCLATIAILLSPLMLFTVGLETALLMGGACWALVAFNRAKPFACGVLLGLTFLARHDAAILIVLVALAAAILTPPPDRRHVATQLLGACAIVALPWILFSVLYYHGTVPTTLQAKLAQGGTIYWPAPYQVGIWRWIVEIFYARVWVAAAVVAGAAVGVGFALRIRDRASVAILLLPAYAVIHVIAYALLGVPDYHWYFVPYALILAALCDFGLTQWLTAITALQRREPLAASYLSAMVGIPLAAFLLPQAPRADPRLHTYRAAAIYLAGNPPRHAAGMKEIGIVGFFASNVRIFDFSGVGSPEQAANVKRSDATAWLSDPNKADLVLTVGGHPLEPDVDPRFDDLYDLVVALPPDSAFPRGLNIWRLKAMQPRRETGTSHWSPTID